MDSREGVIFAPLLPALSRYDDDDGEDDDDEYDVDYDDEDHDDDDDDDDNDDDDDDDDDDDYDVEMYFIGNLPSDDPAARVRMVREAAG